MSNSVRPHRRQPNRLPRPWDSPGKNTGVGCHFLLQCMKVKVKVKSLSRVRLLATPWTAAYQAPLSMGFSRQEYWSGVPLPSPHHGMTIGLFTAVPFTQYIMADYQEKKKMTRHSKYTVGKDTASIRTRQGRDGGMIRPGIGNNYD